jgi:flavin reductase (DIM6/NTAB) family NADH-FMN oxidoreductase RutF
MPLDPDTFRSVLGRFATGVTVVTTCDEKGRDHGMTVSAFSSLSLTPPLVLVCIDQSASMHRLLGSIKHFAVNILSSTQEPISRRFSGKDDDRFDGIGFTRGQTGAALLDDSLAWLECSVQETRPYGDHTLCIGLVETAQAFPQHRPLLYYRGGYATLER